MNRITPENITELNPYQVFVFGSNLQGLHIGGAARVAHDLFGAPWLQSFGFATSLDHSTYAIPTVGINFEVLPLSMINYYVEHFLKDVVIFDEYDYFITKIGCGIAGYSPEDIAPLFKSIRHNHNIYLPQEFIDVIDKL